MKSILVFCLCVAFAATAVAQPAVVNADRIIGVVGNKMILKSDVEDRLADMQRQGTEIPANGRCLVLQDLMGTKTLVLQAEKDSLPISDDDVESDIDNRIRSYVAQFGSKEEVEKVAGKTIYQLKEDMREPIREQKLAVAERNKIVDAIRITPNEVKQFFDRIPKDSLPYYESQVEIGQIIVFPKASRDAEDYAKEQLNSYKAMVESGRKSFKDAAAQYSDEPAAKETGGEIDMNRSQKEFDPAFMAKAFTLKEGQVSNPFKTKFGYHIMQLVSRNGDDIVVRHIIKIPQVTAIELKAGYDRLDSVRAKLIAGTLDFGTAVDRYSDDETGKFTAGMIQGPDGTFLTIDQLDKDVIPVLKTLSPGAYSQPQAYTDATGKQGVRILYLKSKTAPHRENLLDDYSKVSDQALNEKKENALEKWFSDKLSSYYISIDPEYSNCDTMKPWLDAQNKSHTH